MSKIPGIQVDQKLQDALNSTTDHETIRQLLREAAENQGLVLAHSWEENVAPVNTASFSRDLPERDREGRFVPANQTQQTDFKKTEVIGGKPMEFSASSEEQLNTLILQAHQVAEALQPQAPRISAAEKARHAQELNDLEQARIAEVSMRFRRGQISTKEYLEQSGAIAEYLNDHGAPLEVLQQTVEQVQAANETQSWADAVTTFMESEAAAGWPGGERNTELVGLTLQNLGLVNATDKVAAITQAVNYIKSKEMLFQPEAEVAAERERVSLEEAMAAATSPEEVRAAMENYKTALAARDIDPNEAFIKTFARNGQDATYNPPAPSGEKRASGIFNR